MSAPFVVAAYPLSQGFRALLEERVGGGADYLNLAALRRLPPLQLLRELRSYSGRPCMIAFEDPASEALRPVLHALAVAAGPSAVETVAPDASARPLPTRRLPPALGALVAASVQGAGALLAERRELRRLLAEPRREAVAASTARVLYMNANLWFGVKAGGSVGHVAGVVNGLSALGRDVDLFSVSEPVLVDEGVRYRPLHPPAVLGLPIELNFPRFQRDTVRQVTRSAAPPYDFVYQRLSTATFAGVQVARRLGAPLVLEYNGSEVWIARNWGRPLRYEQYALDAENVGLRHAHVVVTVSRVLRDELVERGVEPERVVWYPNAVDERIYDPDRFDERDRTELRARHGIAPDAVVVAFIGTFGRWHGVDVLARTIARLVEDDADWLVRRRVHFLLVGDGLRMPEARELLAAGLASGRVTLAGLVPQAEGARYLAASDVLVSPHVPNDDASPFFGSPTKLFEYMAMGRGIVASRLDQIGDVLADSLDAAALPQEPPGDRESRLAVLAVPGSEAELAAGIRFLVDEEGWRRVLGANARAEALARYTWRHHVQAILDGLDRVRGGGDGRG